MVSVYSNELRFTFNDLKFKLCCRPQNALAQPITCLFFYKTPAPISCQSGSRSWRQLKSVTNGFIKMCTYWPLSSSMGIMMNMKCVGPVLIGMTRAIGNTLGGHCTRKTVDGLDPGATLSRWTLIFAWMDVRVFTKTTCYSLSHVEVSSFQDHKVRNNTLNDINRHKRNKIFLD